MADRKTPIVRVTIDHVAFLRVVRCDESLEAEETSSFLLSDPAALHCIHGLRVNIPRIWTGLTSQ